MADTMFPMLTINLLTAQFGTGNRQYGGYNAVHKYHLTVRNLFTPAGELHAVWKPVDGEKRDLRNGIPCGTYYVREALAYAIAKIVNMYDLVPPTVIRELNGTKGSLQQWRDGMEARNNARPFSHISRFDIERAAAYDYVIGNTDRHAGNWLIGIDDKPVLIDNGLSFGIEDSGRVSQFLSYLMGHFNFGLATFTPTRDVEHRLCSCAVCSHCITRCKRFDCSCCVSRHASPASPASPYNGTLIDPNVLAVWQGKRDSIWSKMLEFDMPAKSIQRTLKRLQFLLDAGDWAEIDQDWYDAVQWR
jgi:Phosphatidylinositol 3- and 4-kinase